jgi:anti-sigma regulatory factor (Ser/Thr protein kinase)
LTWPLRAYLELEVADTAPRQARHYARQALGEWGLADLAEDAELVISELVTNAVQATAALPATPFAGHPRSAAPHVRLWLSADKGRLLILVWDPSDELPARPDHTPT